MAEHHLKAVAFPTLDEAQMAALGRCPLTTLKRYRDEEKLFEACERDFKFFVQRGQGRHQATSITIISPPPPRISMLLFVVWWPMWQWISHFPGCRAVQMTS